MIMINNIDITSNNNTSPTNTNNDKTSEIMNMEELVENWLASNKDWFRLYAIENLDLSTVEKWLRLHDKKICKCNNKLNEDAFGKENFYNKRNSIAGPPLLVSHTINPNTNDNAKQSNPKLDVKLAPKKMSFDASFSRNLLVNGKGTPVLKPSSREDVNNLNNNLNSKSADFSSSNSNLINGSSNSFINMNGTTPIQMINGICHSNNNNNYNNNNNANTTAHSHNCVIHNRPSLSSIKNRISNDHSFSMMPFTEELNNDDDNSADMGDKSIEHASLANEAINTTSKANRRNLNNLHYDASNLISLSKRNNLMRKYHTFYSNDSTTSLSLLKLLIESKIKFPTQTTSSSLSNNSSSNGSNGVSDKLKSKREKKQENEFLLDIIKDISNELNLKTLSEKIIHNLKALVNAEKASLFFVCHSRKCLASFKFDPHAGIWDASKLSGKSIFSMSDSSHTNDFDLEIPFGNSIIGNVAENGAPVNIPNIAKVKIRNIFVLY